MQINDDNSTESPFSNFKVGQAVKARIIGIKSDANKRGGQFELSMSPSVLTGNNTSPVVEVLCFINLSFIYLICNL